MARLGVVGEGGSNVFHYESTFGSEIALCRPTYKLNYLMSEDAFKTHMLYGNATKCLRCAKLSK